MRVNLLPGNFFIFLSICAGLANAKAPITDIQFQSYSVSKGLSQNTVTSIVEDRQGFMWFATADGLNRFDGYDFKQYHHDVADEQSLPGGFIRQLYTDSFNQLWIGTHKNGLARYLPDKESFERYSLDGKKNPGTIWAFGSDDQGQLLVADDDHLYRFNQATREFSRLSTRQQSLPSEIKVIFTGQDCCIIGTYGNGIYHYDPDTGSLNQLTSINARFLFDLQLINDELWFGTEQGAIVTDQDLNIKRTFSANTTPRIVGNAVRAIEKGNNGQVWIGTDKGISIISQDRSHSYNLNDQNQSQANLNSSFILDIKNDTKGNIWLGGYTGGIHRYNAAALKIKHFKGENELGGNVVWSVAEDSNGDIWLASQNGGLTRYNPNTGQFSKYLQQRGLTLFDMKVDSRDRIWISASDGVHLFQIRNNQLNPLQSFSLPHIAYNFEISKGHVWFSSNENNQLFSIDLDSLEISSLSTGDSDVTSVLPTLVDESNHLWLLTNRGLTLLNLSNHADKQRTFNIQNRHFDMVSAIAHQGFYWIATNGDGLLQLDQDYQLLRHYTLEDGLSSNNLTGLYANGDNIWITNLKSVDQLSIGEQKIEQKITSDMLDFNSLNEGSGFFSQAGILYLGGSDGFFKFTPSTDSAQKLEPLPPPLISALSIRNFNVTVNSEDSPLSRPIHLQNELTLNNDAYPFALTLTALTPLRPEKIEYRYRLSGITNGWLIADTRTRQAVFTNNLLFGTYTFEAQAREDNGTWSKSRKLLIKIQPPIWLSPWAILLYLSLGILFVSYWLKRIKTLRKTHRAIKVSEERLKLTLWGSGDELWDWNIPNGKVHRSNTWNLLSFPEDNVRADLSHFTNIHPCDLERAKQALNDHLDGKTDYYESTYRVKIQQNQWLWLLDRGKVVERDNKGKALRMTGTLKNIGHLKKAEEQLKLFKRSIETISDGVFITNTSFRFVSVNQSYCKYTGETRQQALASYLEFRQYPDAFTQEVRKSLRSKGNWKGELEACRINGEKYEMELNIDAIKNDDGDVTHFVGVFSDISERRKTEKELLKLTNIDPLTNLPNRSFFQTSHQYMVKKGQPHALICLDMDNFKKINDSMGHQIGDILIKQIAKRLQKFTGVNSTCYRLGGDEFSILLENKTDVHSITRFVQRIIDEMTKPFTLENQEFVVTASVGIAFYPNDGFSPQEMLKNADTAMYFAKNSGGNKYQFFSGEMNQNAVRQLQIENLIRQGLKDDCFTVFYQPKVDISSGKLSSMEALVRFEHPEKGYVSPDQFIPLAEKTGQIIEIGEVVLRKACTDTKRWVDQGLFNGRVAINISAKQFELPDLDQTIIKILQESKLSPLHLECEITEGTLMHDPEQAMHMMQRLKEIGIHLALDDFGTGYSSLAYLKHFPLNTVKIDKAFIDGIATSHIDKKMAAAIIDIAHNLGLKVVAEGVEKEDQLNILRHYKCEMLQGYLYSKPLNANRFERLLEENHQLDQIIKSSSKAKTE